uniref:Three-finger toxin n=1 Tax=Calliophis bivirgatus TaxID=8633 RepID=A0A898ILQ5_CALBG|nr:three-finger toxin [Calliophis bivirgatus]
MKTLLLTLVVVTIVCLDLGYTLQCYKGNNPKILVTCEKGQNECYIRTFPRPPVMVRGCTSHCLARFTCCSTDKCNK